MVNVSRHGKAHRLRGEGWTFKEISLELGYADASGAARAVASYAKRLKAQDLRPLQKHPRSERAGKAYGMKARDLTWSFISEQLGYASGASARTCAKSWARAAEKPWPPRFTLDPTKLEKP